VGTVHGMIPQDSNLQQYCNQGLKVRKLHLLPSSGQTAITTPSKPLPQTSMILIISI